MQGLFLLVAVAVAARVAYEALAPLLPGLVVLLVLGFIILLILRR